MSLGSKNVEATGERNRPYDLWRRNVADLPPSTFISLEYIEHSPSPDRNTFDLHCVIIPKVIDSELPERLLDVVKTEDQRWKPHIQWIHKLNMPFYCSGIDNNFQKFMVKSVDTNSEALLLDQEQFIKRIIRQRINQIHGVNTGLKIGEMSSYSTWHRSALTSDSYLHDIDYIELRNGNPVTVIEATKSNSADPWKGFFDFFTRGYTQCSILLEVAERLNVPCWIVVYKQDMSELLVVKINRAIIENARPLNYRRAEISKFFENQGDPRRVAQGKACDQLFKENQAFINQLQQYKGQKIVSLDIYRQGLLKV